ncbi:TrbC/VirB2 family protein (plasmid) [Sphaerotilaceae bacterium SBD11-9]
MKVSKIIQQARGFIARNKAAHAGDDQRATRLALLTVMFGVVLMPSLAHAAPWDGAAAQVLALLTGGLTRTIAIVACIAAGIAAFFGKLSWDWVIKIVIGIVLVFGSAAIVDYFIAASS